MPKKGKPFHPYIFQLFLKIKDFLVIELSQPSDYNFKVDVTNDMYWKVFNKPKHNFMPDSYDIIFKHFLAEFENYENWNDFESKELGRWINYGSPSKENWHIPIQETIDELKEKYLEKKNPNKRLLAQDKFRKVEEYEKQHEYRKAILECKKCVKLNPELHAFTFKLVELLLKQMQPFEAMLELENLETSLVSDRFLEVFRHNLALTIFDFGIRIGGSVGNSFKNKSVSILKELYLLQETNNVFNLDAFLKIGCSYMNVLLELNERPQTLEILKYIIDRSSGQSVRIETSLRIRFYESLLLKESEKYLVKLFDELLNAHQLDGKAEFLAEIALNIASTKVTNVVKLSVLKKCFDFPMIGYKFSRMEYKAMLALAELAESVQDFDLALECYTIVIKDPNLDDDLKHFITQKKLSNKGSF
jgi:hypothetical protein